MKAATDQGRLHWLVVRPFKAMLRAMQWCHSAGEHVQAVETKNKVGENGQERI